MNDQAKLREQVRQIRALIHAMRQRIAGLRPVWGAYLAGETMNSLEHAVDELEKEIGLAEPENRAGAARMPGARLNETGGSSMANPKTRGWVAIHAEECKGCGLCIAVCPAGCLELLDDLNHQGYHPAHYVGDGCRADGLCFYACPEPGAIEVFKGDPAEMGKKDE